MQSADNRSEAFGIRHRAGKGLGRSQKCKQSAPTSRRNALRSLRALLPRLQRATRELGLAVAAPEHEQGHEVVGVAEVVAHSHRHLDFVVDGLCASVADAELAPGRPAALARGPGGVSVANPPRELRLLGALALKAACSVYRAMMTVTNSGIIFSRSRLRPVGFRTSLPGS